MTTRPYDPRKIGVYLDEETHSSIRAHVAAGGAKSLSELLTRLAREHLGMTPYVRRKPGRQPRTAQAAPQPVAVPPSGILDILRG